MSDDSKPAAPQAQPQWDPPARVRDPYVRRLLIERAYWMRAIRGRIPKIHDAAVATYLAAYGNKDGTRCHPGVARLASDLFLSEATVKRSLAWLGENGWITCTERGDRWAGRADVFRLTLPAPLAVELGKWSGEDSAQWMERPAGMPKRAGVRTRMAPKRQGRQGRQGEEIGSCKDETGSCNGDIGCCSGGDRCPSLALPPEPLHQNLSHHSELLAPPRATARGSIPKIDPDDEGVSDLIIEYVESVAGLAGHFTRTMVDGMLSEGRPIPAIINAAVENVRNGDDPL